MNWTQEAIDTLTAKWRDGWTASRIAALFAIDGCTRNAVIGKVSRLRLIRTPKGPRASSVAKPPQNRPVIIKVKAMQPKVRPVAVVGLPAEPAPLLSCKPVTLAQRQEHHCCWPLGDPYLPSFRYCGATRDSAASLYCETHRAIAYGPGTPSERKVTSSLVKKSHLTRVYV